MNIIKQKINRIVGSIGAFIGIVVFIAYIPQIIANLQGNKAQPFQPLVAAVSCLIWVIYGWTKEPKRGLGTNHSKFSWCYFRWNHFLTSL